MSDKSKCVNSLCRIRDTCERYSSISNDYWQFYTNFGEACTSNNFYFYIPIKKGDD